MYIGILILSVIAYMILGFLWYAPFAFGKRWMNLTGKGMDAMDKEKMTMVFGLSALGALIQAIILSYLMVQFNVKNLNQAIILSTMLGVGFSFPAILTNNLYQQKKIELTFIDAGYQIAGIVLMGVILFFFL